MCVNAKKSALTVDWAREWDCGVAHDNRKGPGLERRRPREDLQQGNHHRNGDVGDREEEHQHMTARQAPNRVDGVATNPAEDEEKCLRCPPPNGA